MPQWVHTIRGPNMKEEDMRIRNVLIGKLVASLCLMIAITSGFAGEKQKYHFMVFSNAANGKEDTYLKWYEGQHIHDLLAIPGFVAAQFFKLSDTQYAGAQQQHYLMVWEIETDDLPRVFADVKARLKDGRTVFTDAFVGGFSTTMSPITKSVTAEEIEGKGIDEVEAIANGK
jgi:hypothetical protein